MVKWKTVKREDWTKLDQILTRGWSHQQDLKWPEVHIKWLETIRVAQINFYQSSFQ